jgi:hypothetical protein
LKARAGGAAAAVRYLASAHIETCACVVLLCLMCLRCHWASFKVNRPLAP